MNINDKNFNDSIKKILKYFIYFMIIYIILLYVPCNTISSKDLYIISMLGTISFSLLDILSPSITIINKK